MNLQDNSILFYFGPNESVLSLTLFRFIMGILFNILKIPDCGLRINLVAFICKLQRSISRLRDHQGVGPLELVNKCNQIN